MANKTNRTMINNKIKDIATSYLGQREIPGNMGFTDKSFEKKMQAVGFVKSYAWCALFAELVWTEAYAGSGLVAKLRKLFSASATTTFKNFDIDGTFKTSKVPQVGAVAIWRHGSGWQGHAGIVVGMNEREIHTVEGNTNAAGGREGIEVAKKTRNWMGEAYKPNGLNLVGFILPA